MADFHNLLVRDTAPVCGLKCIVQLVQESTCSLTNTTCVCTNAPLTEQITACVISSCTVVDQLATTKYTKDFCGVVPVDHGAEVVIVPMVIGAITLLAFGLRIVARTHITKGAWGFDDWVITAAVLFMLPLLFLSIPLSQYGLGKDIWNIPPDNITQILHLYFWDELVYFPAIALTKISILMFYLDVFRRSIARVQPIIYVLIVLNVLFGLIFVLISVFQCTPIPGAWLAWDGEHKATCRNINAQAWAGAAINIVLDVSTVVLPLPELWQLSLSRGKKIQLMFMFSLGFLVTIVSILRLHSIISFATTSNLTQDYVVIGVWTTVEVPVGVLCACLPAVRNVLKVLFPVVFRSTRPSRSNYYQSAGLASNGFSKSQPVASANEEKWTSPRDPGHWDELNSLELHPVSQGAESHVSSNEPTTPKELA